MTIAAVALDVPLHKTFDFLIAQHTKVAIGNLVVVPFGKPGRFAVGLVTNIGDASEVPAERLKAIERVIDTPPFTPQDFALLRFCERYYHFPLGQIALNAVPPRLRSRKPFSAHVARSVTITAKGQAALPEDVKRSPAVRAMLEALAAAPTGVNEATLTSRFVRGTALLKKLLEKEFAQVTPSRAFPAQPEKFVAAHTLNAEQAAAADAIGAAISNYAPFLLEGITGSGKTEVYLHAIARALAANKQVLVLVPEINLSPAFVRAIAARFPNAQIAELHSGLADVPRTEAWLCAQRGDAHIVIGTRLAVFTPMPRLGLIVVDEEHDTSYKQQERLRYSARDVAVFRAHEAKCPVVLGSATPSLETLHNALRQRFTHVQLTQRASANAALPKVEFIDINVERMRDGLSSALIRAIDETVKRGEQALVFINRRGFAPALVCGQCGWMPSCTRCAARLVFHRGAARLRCHHCGFQTRVPEQCGDCGSMQLIAAGEGTERVEAALAAALPGARLARVDRDSTSRVGALEKIFAQAEAGELDVLIGTQMLSKGHDLRALNLVGVVNADSALFSADFRAAERLAQQLVQVAGRAGRAGSSGRVLIQTRFPNHPVFAAAAAHDYAQYARAALEERRLNKLPPSSFLALLRAESQKRPALDAFFAEAKNEADTCAHALESEIQVWDPIPSTLAKKAGFERFQLLIQAESRPHLQAFLLQWLPRVRALTKREIRWLIDVDPQEV